MARLLASSQHYYSLLESGMSGRLVVAGDQSDSHCRHRQDHFTLASSSVSAPLETGWEGPLTRGKNKDKGTNRTAQLDSSRTLL